MAPRLPEGPDSLDALSHRLELLLHGRHLAPARRRALLSALPRLAGQPSAAATSSASTAP
jgi:hypothetical protein